MIPALLFLFTVLLVPAVEGIWGWLWVRALYPHASADRRVRWLGWRMVGGIALAVAGAWLVVAGVFPRHQDPALAPHSLMSCLGHTLEHGPGEVSLLVLVGWMVGFGLLAIALFAPVPSLPSGTRRPDMEARVARYGIGARVELLRDGDPGCFSEDRPVPRLVLTGGVEDLLADDEMEAALAHEAAHLAKRDHGTRLWGRAFSRLLFLWREAASLFALWAHEQERRADDQVLAWRPELRGALERALFVLATRGVPEPVGASAGMLGQEAWSVKERIVRLRGGAEELPEPPRMSVWGLAGLALLLGSQVSPPVTCALHCMLAGLP